MGEIEKIEDTIFSIVNSPEHGWFLSIGQQRITEPTKTRDETLKQLGDIPPETWNIIMKMIIIVVDAANAEAVINETHYYDKMEDRIRKNQE